MGRGDLCARRSATPGQTTRSTRFQPLAVLCAGLATLLLASTASAAPITFYFSGGSADITATAGATTIVDTTVSLDGAFVTFDDAVPELVDFSITLPQSPPIATLSPYGSYDTFIIESAMISPGGAFLVDSINPTGPNTWSFVVGPVDVDGNYSACNAPCLGPPPVDNVPAPFTGSSFLNGSIDTDAMTFELLGITLAELDGGDFGEANDLIIKADITWSGVVPEPGTATLLGCGLAGLAARRRAQVRGEPTR